MKYTYNLNVTITMNITQNILGSRIINKDVIKTELDYELNNDESIIKMRELIEISDENLSLKVDSWDLVKKKKK